MFMPGAQEYNLVSMVLVYYGAEQALPHYQCAALASQQAGLLSVQFAKLPARSATTALPHPDAKPDSRRGAAARSP
jgi:hypothetical protein